jgi:arylsulfatase A-like enzyme
VPLVFGLSLALLATGGCSAGPRERPNVVLITLDTTRADHLGLYGYERPTSPRLDALAEEATVYERAYSTSSWTLPAHASLFTGRYPSSHGARHDPQGGLVLAEGIPAAPQGLRARAMSRSERTLAALLAEAGYATGAVVAGPWMLRQFGLAAGFAHYDDEGIRDAQGRRAREVTERARSWLAEAPEPFFLFLNYFDPHLPYAPPPAWAKSFLPPGVRPDPRDARQAAALYDAEILYMDYEVGRLFEFLRERGLWERTLIVVTGDHGELLGDRGLWGHERFLWEPLVRVPLVVKPAGPRRAGARERAAVSLVDVMPMVLADSGVGLPPGIQGELPPARARPLLAEVHPMSADEDTGVWKARWEGPLKYLQSSKGERYLFDVERDPGETEDLAAADPSLAARARRGLEDAFAALPAPPPGARSVTIDEETREALRRLGYLGSEEEPPRSQTRTRSSE